MKDIKCEKPAKQEINKKVENDKRKEKKLDDS
jgi:hypothetical protein